MIYIELIQINIHVICNPIEDLSAIMLIVLTHVNEKLAIIDFLEAFIPEHICSF